jgi:hypothetical protein
MRTSKTVLALMLLCSLPALAGDKQKGTTTLKDLQPVGTPDKDNKNQQFDLTIEASGSQYICRTSRGDKIKATEFPVGGQITYEFDEDKGKIKSSRGKKLECKVMRVEALQPPAAPSN